MTCITRVFPNTPRDIETIKEEIWADLSALYYKYDYDFQKRAFREVLKEMSEKITAGKWSTVYKRMYQSNGRPTFL
ncbi:MAG: hypothetical protein JSV18_05755 [Candidatus Bathyarchaeota archaeon]|nr:MAG: hypothetical protein JSV18_05755 [Candidatus Bathyarchaeota archaeon]